MSPELLRSYERELRFGLRPPPGRRREDDGRLVRIRGPGAHPLDDMVCASRLTAAEADEAIEALVAHAERERRGVQWNVYAHDEPSDLVERLERRGFRSQGEERVLVRPSAEPEAPGPAPGPSEVGVRRIERVADLAPVLAIQEAVWGPGHTDWLLQWWGPALAGEADPVAIFVGTFAGRDAGLGWVTLPRGGSFASLFGGTVLPEHRRRGVYPALVRARAQAAAQAGLPWLVVDANAMSAPRLLRLGFEHLTTRTELVWPAPAGPGAGCGPT